ncbi:MAG: hypothetical protein ABIV36_24330 [Sphingobium limneticum]
MADINEFKRKLLAAAASDPRSRTKLQALGEHLGSLAINEAYGDKHDFADVLATIDEARRYVEQCQLRDRANRLLGYGPRPRPSSGEESR